jgi:hypothetical protein
MSLVTDICKGGNNSGFIEKGFFGGDVYLNFQDVSYHFKRITFKLIQYTAIYPIYKIWIAQL